MNDDALAAGVGKLMEDLVDCTSRHAAFLLDADGAVTAEMTSGLPGAGSVLEAFVQAHDDAVGTIVLFSRDERRWGDPFADQMRVRRAIGRLPAGLGFGVWLIGDDQGFDVCVPPAA